MAFLPTLQSERRRGPQCNIASSLPRVRSGEEASPTWTAYVGKMFSAASSYLPTGVTGMMSQDRAFATAHLLAMGRRNICTLAV